MTSSRRFVHLVKPDIRLPKVPLDFAPRRAKVLEFILKRYEATGRFPSCEEIQATIPKTNGKRAVYYFLDCLVVDGYIRLVHRGEAGRREGSVYELVED